MNIKEKITDNRVIRAVTPLGLALLAVVCISGVFIYPYLFSAADLGGGSLQSLARQLLVTALVAQVGALIPALVLSFARENFSITLTLVWSLSTAVFFSWVTMLIQQILPVDSIAGFSGTVLNVMFAALIGSVLSIVPALLATLVCILRRILGNFIASRKV